MLKNKIHIVSALLLLIVAFTVPNWFATYKSEQDFNNFQEQILQQEQLLLKSIEQLESKSQLSEFNAIALHRLYSENNIAIFIYHIDSLRFWNQDELMFDVNILHQDDGVYQLANGWYYLKSKVNAKGEQILGLLKIKSQYSYQNRHLKTEFTDAFQFQTIDKLSKDKNGKAITNSEGKLLFYLESKPLFASAHYQALLFFLSFILSFILISASIHHQNMIVGALIRIAMALFYRLLLYFFSPEYLEYVEFFRPNWYAINEWIPSFADFIINSILIFYLSIEGNKVFKQIKNQYAILIKNSLSVLLGVLTVEWISSSIMNSTFSYNLVNFFEWNIFSLSSLIGFSFLLLASVNFCSTRTTARQFASEMVILLAITSTLSLTIEEWNAINPYHFWVFIPLLSMKWFNQKSYRSFLIIGNLIYVATIAATLISEKYNAREELKKNFILQKLTEEKDEVAEYLFQSIDSSILNDQILKQILLHDQYDVERIAAHLNEKYFSGYWNKYSILYYPCFEGDTILLNNQFSLSCFDYYHDRIKYEGTEIGNTSFYQLSNLAGRIDYLGDLKISLQDSSIVDLYIELSSSIVNQFEGYPELLIDERSNLNHLDISRYSYAVYHQGSLVFKSGEYNYPIETKEQWTNSNPSESFAENGFHHLLHQKNEDTLIFLSEKDKDFTDQYTSIAYLLILLSLLVALLSTLSFEFKLKIQLNWSDFASRIQLFLLTTLFLAVSLFLIGTLFYIQKQNEEKNNKAISEKLRSVRVELESKVGGERAYNDSLINYYNALLIDFSNVFYTDINLFDNKGQLFATSRPEIFDKGLKSKRIHPLVFSNLVEKEKSEWVQKERIGNMEYISAYVPIRNDFNKILGYLNLPYFAKQEELENEISDFFVSTVNIYVAIFALALFISLLLANQLSRPLSLIRNQISKLKLGGDLELIKWKGNDEIGALVREYNRMVVELSDSVEQLAQSERESAWREMAKQVAHEIKNPLTPMKLSIQHLQMAYERNAEDLDVRIKKTTQTLIEQIDTLANIANEFSHFAKMPEGKMESINLLNTIENAIHLYDTYEDVRISIQSTVTEIWINGDDDQLLRLFNNLIKNSLQAKVEGKSLEVIIRLEKTDQSIVIDVIDNGIGIPEDKKEKIFEPNFTTKSSGTGLGLAMSRRILQNMGGSIQLKQKEDGAHFQLTLPYFDKEKMV